MPLRPALLLAGSALALLAGCGGGSSAPVASTPSPPAARTAPQPQGVDPRLLPPKGVPSTGTRAAAPAARRVIDGWLRALRAGDVARASRYFAVPSVFQNGTPVLRLNTARQVRAVVGSFPCGAIATSYRAAGAYTVVRFRLTHRRGGDCGTGTGGTAGSTIRVAHGRITEWYRTYEPQETPPAESESPPDAHSV